MASAVPNIANFISNIQANKDLSKSDKFTVEIYPPNALSGFLGNSARSLTYQTEGAELPGISLNTLDYRVYGPNRKLPIQTFFNEINLTIVCTNVFYEKPFFDWWINYINPRGSAWDFRYKDEFVGKVDISQYDLSGNVIYTSSLFKAFPVNISPLPLHWSDDSPNRLSVLFAYDYWTSSNSTPTAALLNKQSNQVLGAVQNAP